MHMKVLVTGATGFIGPYLVRELVKRGHKCKCLIRRTTNIEKIKNLDIEFVYGDITNRESLKGVTKDIDVVYHLATLGHVNEAKYSFQGYYEINVQGTKNLAEECIENPVKRFIYFTTAAAIGPLKKEVIDETEEGKPVTIYGKSKQMSEKELLKYWREKGLPVIMLRLSMVYGPGDTRDLLKLCRLVKKGFFLKIGFGKNLTPAVFVTDVVQAAILAMEKGRFGEVYNITYKNSFEYNYMRKLILGNLGIKRPYFWMPTSVAKIGASVIEFLAKTFGFTPIITYQNIISITASRVFSIEKARRELGYEPKVDIEEGIKTTVEWYKEKGYL